MIPRASNSQGLLHFQGIGCIQRNLSQPEPNKEGKDVDLTGRGGLLLCEAALRAHVESHGKRAFTCVSLAASGIAAALYLALQFHLCKQWHMRTAQRNHKLQSHTMDIWNFDHKTENNENNAVEYLLESVLASWQGSHWICDNLAIF